MKIFVYILSIYILFLTALPCIDKPEHVSLVSSEITQKTTDSHHESDSDHCSPFCTCSCCASPVIQKDFLIKFEGFPIILEAWSTEYTSTYTSGTTDSIWQPPKLA